MTGRKPVPTAIRRANGNPGGRAWNHDEPIPPATLPTCPRHLTAAAKVEWKRIATCLHRMGVLTRVDRAALAAYCQAWGRWVEAEGKLKETPLLIRTPSGYVEQSPWLSVANRQLEIMGRYMAELGITPASRSRVKACDAASASAPITFNVIYEQADGTCIDADGRPVERGITDRSIHRGIL